MKPTMKRIVELTVWSIAAIIVVAGGFLLSLVYIGDPGEAASLQFQGFVHLPSTAMLTVLDYMTVSDHRLFVTDETTGSVYKINLRENALPQSSDVAMFASVPAAHGIALDPATRTAFVTRSEANTVDKFDPTTMRSIGRVPVAEDADAIVFDSVHNVVYIANGDAHVATLIDPKTLTVAATIPLGGKPEFAAFDPQTTLIYQNLRDTNAIAAVDIDARAVAQRWPLPGCTEPSGMALDEVRRRLFVVCAGNAMLAVFDLDARKVSSLLSIGGGPDSVAYDSELRRIYTTGKAGVLTIIRQDNPDAYHILDSVKLHYGAHTLAVDPDTHRLYIAYASLFVPARVAVFTPRP